MFNMNTVNRLDSIIMDRFGFTLRKNQLKCCKYLLSGDMVELPTGEGKSIVSLVSSVLLSESHETVYLVSVNDYLCRRDYEKFKDIYDEMDITCSLNISTTNESDKKDVHSCNVIFTNAETLAFDYLSCRLGHYDFNLNLDCAIVDECDYVLLDNATSEFSISFSHSDFGLHNLSKYKFFYNFLCSSDFKVLSVKNSYTSNIDCSKFHSIVDFNKRDCLITESGINYLSKLFGISVEGIVELYNVFVSCVSAKYLYIRGEDYDILDDKIVPINKNNGRLGVDSRLDNDIHCFLEIKENIDSSDISDGSAYVSYQILFNKFNFLCGMSGTLSNTSDEFSNIFGKRVRRVSRHKKRRLVYKRKSILKSKQEKYDFLLSKLDDCVGDSVLIITGSNNETDLVYKMLENSKVVDNFSIRKLDYFDDYSYEEKIIDSAGLPSMITVCSYLCGRGSDIKVPSDNMLHLFSLNNFSNTRIDDQIIGRCSRNGSLGGYHFITSLEDEIYYKSKFKLANKIKSINDKYFPSHSIQKCLSYYTYVLQKCSYFRLAMSRERLFDLSTLYDMQLYEIFYILNNFSRVDILYSINLYLRKLILDSPSGMSLFGFEVNDSGKSEFFRFVYDGIVEYVMSSSPRDLNNVLCSSFYKNFNLFKFENEKLLLSLCPRDIRGSSKFIKMNRDLYDDLFNCSFFTLCDSIVNSNKFMEVCYAVN